MIMSPCSKLTGGMKYELMVILDPKLTEKELKKSLEDIKKIAEGESLKLLQEEEWGMRELSYMIKGRNKGYYSVMLFEGSGKGLPEIHSDLRIQPSLLRYLILKMPEAYTIPRYEDMMRDDFDLSQEDVERKGKRSRHAEELSKKVSGQKAQSQGKEEEKPSEDLEEKLDAIMTDSDLKL